MKLSKSLVSIILPVHNSSKYLQNCLKSLLSQTYTEIEIIAVDDNSKDESYKILREFKKKDKRIRLYRNIKNYGPVVTLNRALRRAKGAFVAFTHPNDKASKFRIKKQLFFLQSNPKIALVGTQCAYVDEKNKKIQKSVFPQNHDQIAKTLITGTGLQFETTMINRTVLPQDILKVRGNSYRAFTTQLLVKILKFGQLANLSESLHQRRTKPRNLSSRVKKLPSFLKLGIQAITEHGYRPQVSSLFSPLLKHA